MRPLTMIHTSDWHLGRNFYDKDRYEEHKQFFQWLFFQIQEHNVDLLVVSGDIFDTANPSNRSLCLYTEFLNQVTSETKCQIVITAGNHDSPSYISAMRNLLSRVHVHVVGGAARADSISDEVFFLKDNSGNSLAIVAAVPYLREADVRQIAEGETTDDQRILLQAGIRRHYELVTTVVRQYHEQAENVPMILMGHLFTEGNKLSLDRTPDEFHIGTLGYVDSRIFDELFDYVALGHLHLAQTVKGNETRRYSGCPLQLDFPKKKNVCSCPLVHFDDNGTTVELLEVPVFQNIASISGTMKELENQLDAYIQAGTNVWLEVLYTGDVPITDLNTQIRNRTQDTCVEPLRINNKRALGPLSLEGTQQTSLRDYTAEEIFEQFLKQRDCTPEEKTMLRDLYAQAVQGLHEEDTNAK